MKKTILIIGANSDIAKEISKSYLKTNCFLYLITSNEEELLSFDDGIFKDNNISIINVDYKNNFNLQEILSNLKNKPKTIIIANGYIGENNVYDENELKKIFNINFLHTANYSEQAISFFLKNGIKGKLGVFSSVAGLRGRSKNYIYGSAKSAIITYLSGLRQKYYSRNISVTTIILGFVNTKMFRATEKKNAGSFMVSNPKKIAANILKSIENRKEVYFPFRWRIVMKIINLIPEKFFKNMNF